MIIYKLQLTCKSFSAFNSLKYQYYMLMLLWCWCLECSNICINGLQSHTILLVQPTKRPEGRTYADYESVNECMEGKIIFRPVFCLSIIFIDDVPGL